MNQPYQQAQAQGFGFNVNDYEPQKAFDNLPNGWYNVLVSGSEMKDLDNGNGTKLSNEYTVFGGAFNDRKLFDNLNIIHTNEEAQKISRSALRAIQDALLKPVNGPLDLIQTYMCVKVGIDKPKKDATEAEKLAHEPRNVIRGYKPFDQALHQTNSQMPAQGGMQGGAPQGYNVQVTPQGNAAPQFNPQQLQQSPQYAQQPMQQAAPQYNPQQQAAPQQQPQQAAPQQQYQQAAPQPQFNPQQQAPQQQAPQQQAAPQQQYAPQPNAPQQQQQYVDPNSQNQQPQNMQPPANGQPQEYLGQPGQVNTVPGATVQDGQHSQAMAAPAAQQQAAPQQNFAPQQNGQVPQGNVPPPQQSQQGNAMPPGQNAQPPMNQQPQQQQQQQAPNQPQMAAPNQQFAPPGGQQPTGTPAPPGSAW